MSKHILTGFGFGPIQAGLFVAEAYKSGNFSRLVVSEIDQEMVEAIRRSGGKYYVNIAANDGIQVLEVEGLELFNPQKTGDKQELQHALAEATEITTALPSVDYYTMGKPSIADLLAHGIINNISPAKLVYTGENNNQAAEILEQNIHETIGKQEVKDIQFLNTVIGKMSRVVTESSEIKQLGLKTVTEDLPRAFLTEEFNKILVTQIGIEGLNPGIEVFIEKTDLLPFEEAKLYGHNAIHALLAYLGYLKGYVFMEDVGNDDELMDIARKAFIDESGRALVRKYSHMNDKLFTPKGYAEFADDLLSRMINPFLADTIERAARDPVRKLGYDDRLFGTMKLALEQEVEPDHMALGTMAAVVTLMEQSQYKKMPFNVGNCPWQRWNEDEFRQIILGIWNGNAGKKQDELISRVYEKKESLMKMVE